MTGDAADLGALLERRRVPAAALPARGAHAATCRPRLPPVVALVAAAAVAVVAALGWLSGWAGPVERPGELPPAAPPAAADAAAADPDWRSVLADLDAARARAFAAADAAVLSEVYVAGAPAAAADRALLRRLAEQGRTVHGLRRELREVAAERTGDGQAVLRVVDVLPTHEVRDGRGAPVLAVPARGERAFTVVLRRTAGGWRVAGVSAAGGPALPAAPTPGPGG